MIHHQTLSPLVLAATRNLLSELHTLRLTHHLCDVALCVNGTLIYAHRVVLAAARYVMDIFMKEHLKSIVRVMEKNTS